MIGFLALTLTTLAASTVTLVPSDDIWAYPHAGDPSKDAYLRVWGSDGKAAASAVGDVEQFSYGLLKFESSSLLEQKPKSAYLVLWNVNSPSFTLEQAKKAPLQARPVGSDFSEKAWEYSKIEKLMPPSEDKSVFGETSPSSLGDAAPFEIRIDLLKGPGNFADYIVNARKLGKPLSIALTAALEVSENRASYKLFSKDAEREALRPSLVIEY